MKDFFFYSLTYMVFLSGLYKVSLALTVIRHGAETDLFTRSESILLMAFSACPFFGYSQVSISIRTSSTVVRLIEAMSLMQLLMSPSKAKNLVSISSVIMTFPPPPSLFFIFRFSTDGFFSDFIDSFLCILCRFSSDSSFQEDLKSLCESFSL